MNFKEEKQAGSTAQAVITKQAVKTKQSVNTKQAANLTTPSLAWLSLACCLFTPAQCCRILKALDHPQELFPDGYPDASSLLQLLKIPGLANRGNSLSPQQRLSRTEKLVERSLRWAECPRNHLLTLESSNYPDLLREIPDPPPAMFVTGKPEILDRPQLAIVGSRRSTPAALNLGRRWAGELADTGLVITSGLAIGMDAAAHRGCLEAGGRTLAVMASGPDLCYPKQHQALLADIVHKGAAVTEFPPGLSPIPRNFPQRNRIISGLSLGTLVVEAMQRSGTLVTARHAMEQNREVFAMPGSVLNPQARGCHHLIQQGAKLVQQVSDITHELPIELPLELPLEMEIGRVTRAAVSTPQESARNTGTHHSVENDDKVPAEQQAQLQDLLNAAGFDTVTVDGLCSATGMPVSTVMSLVLILELQSRLKSLGDGRYIRC